jgi:SpoVK/Ycf46/Vps4 family AAA+-type ATPase
MTRVDELEQALLAAVRRAHDEFAMNGFEGMAIVMVKAERELRELADIAKARPGQRIIDANRELASRNAEDIADRKRALDSW